MWTLSSLFWKDNERKSFQTGFRHRTSMRWAYSVELDKCLTTNLSLCFVRSKSPSQVFAILTYLRSVLKDSDLPVEEWSKMFVIYDNMCNLDWIRAAREESPFWSPKDRMRLEVSKVIDKFILGNQRGVNVRGSNTQRTLWNCTRSSKRWTHRQLSKHCLAASVRIYFEPFPKESKSILFKPLYSTQKLPSAFTNRNCWIDWYFRQLPYRSIEFNFFHRCSNWVLQQNWNKLCCHC